MRKVTCAILVLMMLTIVTVPMAIAAVPDEIPQDLGGKTFYGYLVGLKDQFMPKAVFQDAVKYNDQDREQARKAALLLIDATTQKMTESGDDPYYLYLRAFAYELLYQDSGDKAVQALGLADYQKTIDAGGAYAQADYDRLAAMQVQATPLAWQMPQMLTLAEIGDVLGIPAEDLLCLETPYQTSDASCVGAGYSLRAASDHAEATIYVLADPLGGKARYHVLQSFAFLKNTTALKKLGDEALLIGMRNLYNNPRRYTTALVRKDELVIQVRIPAAYWRNEVGVDPAQVAPAIAKKLLANLYDDQRTLPSMAGIELLQAPASLVLDAGLPDSPVPDAMPADLEGKTEYGYIVDIRKQYLPAGVFADTARTEAERNNARRAIRLITDILVNRFDAYGLNPYELEIRGACYAAAFVDTGVTAYRKLAINDYKQAMSDGYLFAKGDFDRLATPLLLPMAEMPAGTSGENVMLLQQWLNQAGYKVRETSTLDKATIKAIKAYEKDSALTPDGVPDIAFLLSLYSKVDDMDAKLPGET